MPGSIDGKAGHNSDCVHDGYRQRSRPRSTAKRSDREYDGVDWKLEEQRRLDFRRMIHRRAIELIVWSQPLMTRESIIS